MDKPIACIQVTSTSIKLLIGYEKGGSPVAVYTREVPIPGIVKEGKIVDEAAFIEALKGVRNYEDPNIRTRVNIHECSLVLPPLGLQIYQNDKITNVVSSSNEVAKIDITNVVSLVKKEPVASGLQIVDIIPDVFILDSGERYSDPPLGKRSSSLAINAKIHAVSADVPTSLERLFTAAEIRISKKHVSTYCLSLLHASYPDLPTSYIMVDYGAKLTTVSLIGKGVPYCSSTFYMGSDDLTDAIAESLVISKEEAEKLKIERGYDTRKSSYNPHIGGGAGTSFFTQKELNAAIESHYESYGTMLTNAIAAMLSQYQGRLDKLPLIITGGGAGLYGLKDILGHLFPNRELHFARPRSLGAREYKYSALLGLLLACSRYRGSLEDNYRGMGSVTRVPQKGKKPTGPEVDAL